MTVNVLSEKNVYKGTKMSKTYFQRLESIPLES